MVRFAILFILFLGFNISTNAFNTQNSEVAKLDQYKSGSRYCLVVGSFSSLASAQKYGESFQSKGYEVSYRDNGKGYYRVCLFNFSTEAEARKRVQELIADKTLKQAWVLAYNEGSAISPKTQPSEKVVKREKPPVEKKKAEPVTNLKAPAPATNSKPVSKEISKPLQQEQTYLHYCLVVGSYASPSEAKEFGYTLRNNGYGIFFRKSESGTYYVCMYNLETKPEAEKRLDKMRHIDGIFTNAWILGYDIVRSNISIDKL